VGGGAEVRDEGGDDVVKVSVVVMLVWQRLWRCGGDDEVVGGCDSGVRGVVAATGGDRN
ncbi:hypothetical protein Tco_0310270, partial [Tanacetum coccineum]